MNRNLRSTVARVLIAIGVAATVLLAGGAPNDFTNGHAIRTTISK